MLLENMSMALHAIKANKMRSFLTMLGIIIGIGSVIAIVSIGDSMRNLYADAYKHVGVNRALVYVSYWVDDFRTSDMFTQDELERTKEVFKDKIEYMDSAPYTETEAYFGRNRVKYAFDGIDYNYSDVQEVNIIYGRDFNEADVKGRKRNVLLEDKGAEMLFGTADCVGKTFRMEIDKQNDEYTVVGVYHQNLTAMEAMMLVGNGSTQAGFLPYTVLTPPGSYFDNLNFYTKDGVDMNTFLPQVASYVAGVKGRDVSEIMTTSVAEEMGSVDSVLGGMSAAVGGIAAISLLVGGIGIMNIMMVSVTERTREIGIRKALGARTKDVMVQFLTESALLSACGGIIGIILGVGLAVIGSQLMGVAPVVKVSVIMAAVGFSALVGIFFGLYPASKAAKSDPIDALRYE